MTVFIAHHIKVFLIGKEHHCKTDETLIKSVNIPKYFFIYYQ